MKQDNHIIVGIHVTNRVKQAGKVQEVLTRHGTHIKTRIGLHDVVGRTSSPSGIILLELAGDAKDCRGLLERLGSIAGVDIQVMVFGH